MDVANNNIKIKRVVEKYGTNIQTGLTTDQAGRRREEAGSFNTVSPPINCPAWVCCLLPCIKSIPSMKAFSNIQPDDAEVLRNSKWVRYDPASLVPGDVIRMEEGDIIPADCILIGLNNNNTTDDMTTTELLVDLRPITGEERLKTITSEQLGGTSSSSMSTTTTTTTELPRLYLGGKVVQGGGMAIVTAIGPDTVLAKLIAERRFPPKEDIFLSPTDAIPLLDDHDMKDEEEGGSGKGIALGNMS